ncbi:universal stress protein [Streptomyces sp. NPDC055189]
MGVDVGLDGRRHCAAAVHHAFEEAARHGAALHVLYAWHHPLLGVLDEQAALRECRRVLSDMVAGWRITHPDVDVYHAVLRGHPAQVLARESAHALALVVGTRGHGRLPCPPGGSFASRVLRHARCPVVAVPPSAACGHTHGRPVFDRLSRWARAAVGRHAWLLARLIRVRLGRAVRGIRDGARRGGGTIRRPLGPRRSGEPLGRRSRGGRPRHAVTASARPAGVSLSPVREPASPREGTSPPAESSR